MPVFARLLGRRRRYQDIAVSIEEHIRERADELIGEGLLPREAEQRARREFGNPALMEERSREAWQWPGFESLREDVRFALRLVRKSPGFAVTIIATLALGIGANVAIFSIVDAALLRPLPYKNADRLVAVWQSDAAHRGVGAWFNTYREFEVWQQNTRSFDKLTALTWATSGKAMEWHGETIPFFALPTSTDFFSMLGEPAQIGRTFTAADQSSPCTLVLANSFWQDKLGAPRDIAGQTVSVDQSACQIIGVMPRTFSFYPRAANAWMLITPTGKFAQKPWEAMTGVFGLLRPGVSRNAAQAELASIEASLRPEAPASMSTMIGAMSPVVLDLQSNFNWLTGRDLRESLWILMAAVIAVLLLACLNIANLLLGRAVEREREMSIRAALGSGRSRLVRQLLTEALVLGFLGTAAGVGLSVLILRWFELRNPMEMPAGTTLGLHWHVLLFAAAAGIGAAMLFGVLPAWRGSWADLNAALKSGERGSISRKARRIPSALCAAQVALSLMLLVGAGLLIESFWRLVDTPVGYRTRNVLEAAISLPKDGYETKEAKNRFYDSLAQSVTALPGVEAVAGASGVTPAEASTLSVRGQSASIGQEIPSVATQDVSAGFFAAMQIPLEQGRTFGSFDRGNTQQVAIINSKLAEQYFAHEDPIGRVIKLGPQDDTTDPWLTVVGVVGNVKTNTVFKAMGYETPPAVYRPLAQETGEGVTLLVATRGNPTLQADALRQCVRKIDPNAVLLESKTLEDWQAQFRLQPRLRTALFGSFALVSLGLAVLGIYGLLTQMVLRRTQEIGVRMALGASRGEVLRNVIREAFVLVVKGAVVGTVASLFAVRLLAGLLYEVQAENATVLLLSSALLLVTALLAAWLPARRAATIDPMRALRTE
jgi:predicted permease